MSDEAPANSAPKWGDFSDPNRTTDPFFFESMLADGASVLGIELRETPRALALYMTERAAHLASISHEPGFALAVIAERDSVALRAGLAANDVARAGDRWLLGLVQGALSVAARVLAT